MGSRRGKNVCEIRMRIELSNMSHRQREDSERRGERERERERERDI